MNNVTGINHALDEEREVIKSLHSQLLCAQAQLERLKFSLRTAIPGPDGYARMFDVPRAIELLTESPSIALAEFLKPIEEALAAHHQHANESCVVYFEQDGKPIEISTDLAEAYQESDLWAKTTDVLILLRSLSGREAK